MGLRSFSRLVPAALMAAALLAPAGRPVLAEVTPLTLYQRCGRSPWIILGDVTDGNDRFAEVRVLEVLKGEYAGESLRVVHRLENFLRKSWEEKIELLTGERVVLFLKRYDPEETDGSRVPDKLAVDDMFASSFGAMGVFPIPAEGEEAYVEAIRAFARATVIQDPVTQEETVLAFLRSENPHILQAGLEQVRDRRLAMADDIPVLMRLVDSSREPVRLNALHILGQVAEDLRAAGRRLPEQPDLVDRLKGKVVSDEPDIYRSEALRVMVLLSGPEEAPFLKRVAREDPSQLVRYQASRALMDLGG